MWGRGLPDIQQLTLYVLVEHGLRSGIRDGRLHCQCGWVADRGGRGRVPHLEHQVEELQKAGLLVRRRSSSKRTSR